MVNGKETKDLKTVEPNKRHGRKNSNFQIRRPTYDYLTINWLREYNNNIEERHKWYG